MATNQETITNEEALQVAIAWSQHHYPGMEVRGKVADRTGDEVFVDLEMPQEAVVMMVHVRRDSDGGVMVDQQETD